MPISPIVLQRRHAELGRIRLGDKGDRGQPQKLSNFRFTSPSEAYIKDLAELYGGDARPWDNNGVPSWEVYTTATSIPVIAVKGGLSQWLEFWQGGGIVHRCDGETNVLTGEACDHEEKVKTRVRGQDVWVNPHAEAKPTTRLSVMLPELEAIGVFRLETHGWNAAAEIPAVAELATYVGDLVPAHLHLVERRSVKDGKTSRFVVPVLDLQIGAARLREIVAAKSGGTVEIEAAPNGQAKAIEASRPDYLTQAKQATAVDGLKQVWQTAHDAGHMTHEMQAEFARIGAALKAPADSAASPAGSGADVDALWQQILAASPEGWTLDDLKNDFAKINGGLTPESANAEHLGAYLQDILSGLPRSTARPATGLPSRLPQVLSTHPRLLSSATVPDLPTPTSD